MTPVEHFPSQSIYSVRLANRGRDSILNDTLQIFLAGEAFAKAPIPAIASGDTASMEIPLSFEPGTLQNPVIVSALALHGPDTLALRHDTIRISTDMIAYDRVSPAMYEDDGRIIIAFSEIECGLDFHLLARDTVTGISLGLNSYGMTPHHRTSPPWTLSDSTLTPSRPWYLTQVPTWFRYIWELETWASE